RFGRPPGPVGPRLRAQPGEADGTADRILGREAFDGGGGTGDDRRRHVARQAQGADRRGGRGLYPARRAGLPRPGTFRPMTDAFAGLMPVVLVILLGAFIRRMNLLDDAGWRGVDQLGYYVLFPAIIIKSLAIADFGTLP